MKNAAGAPASHAQHDRALIARHAAGDPYPGELEQARQLIASCSECARLAADVRVLSSALADAAVPARPRDFRLSPEQAERLRGGRVERLLRRFAAPGLAPVRPLAGVALSLGLAIAAVGAATPAPADVAFQMAGPETRLGGGSEAEQLQSAEPGSGKGSQPDDGVRPPTEEAPAAAEAPAGDPGYGAEGLPAERYEPAGEEADLPPAAADQATGGTSSALVIGGLLIALLSLGTLALVVVARRRFDDPLLR